MDQRTHIAEDPLLRVLADGAGVQDDAVGPLLGVGHAVAAVGQHAPDVLAVSLVLLAAVGVHKGHRRHALALPVFLDFLAEFLLPPQVLLRDYSGASFHGQFLQHSIIFQYNILSFSVLFCKRTCKIPAVHRGEDLRGTLT